MFMTRLVFSLGGVLALLALMSGMGVTAQVAQPAKPVQPAYFQGKLIYQVAVTSKVEYRR